MEDKKGFGYLEYECLDCHNRHTIPFYDQIFVRKRFFTQRKLDCPVCKKKTWQKLV